MTKSLIFCFDGTSNDPSDARQESHLAGSIDDSSITNVLKLHLLFGGDIRGNARRARDRSSATNAFRPVPLEGVDWTAA